MEKQITELKKLLAEVVDLQRAASVLAWEQQTYMPPGGAAARADVIERRTDDAPAAPHGVTPHTVEPGIDSFPPATVTRDVLGRDPTEGLHVGRDTR